MTKASWKRALLLSAALGAAAPAAALAQSAGAPSAAAAAPRPVNAWGHEGSDLRPDPAVRYGVLPNGMRYAVLRNATPPGEVSMRFRFAVGKVYGPDDQHGLAHFIEHMAFNGSTNVPEGEIMKRLERVGLRFGADSNAATGPGQTVYQLDIPAATPEKLEVAFLYMRELASELNFKPAALERERGIIQSEERSQYTPSRLSQIERLSFWLRGQLAARRQTIGDAKAIASGQRETFLDIYRRYYRPEFATFVVVGDVDVDQMEAEIRRRFSDWKAVGPAGEAPDYGVFAPRAVEAKVFTSPGVASSTSLAWLRPYSGRPDSRAERIREIRELLALSTLNRRFARLVEAGGAPFLRAGAGSTDLLRSAELTAVSITPLPGKEAQSLQAAEQEVRRAVRHGVQQRELQRAIDDMRAAVRAEVAGAATRRSAALASVMAQFVDSQEAFLSPAQNAELFEEAVKGFGPAEASAALRAAFQGSGPLIYAESPTPLPGGEQALLAAVTQSQQLAVAPPVEAQAKPWAYTSFGAAGRVVERKTFADLGVTQVRFANGVVLNVKPTQFRADQILVNARVAGGRLALPRDLVTWPATQGGFISGGLGRLTDEERKEALTGKVYSVGLGFIDDAFLLSGSTRKEDLATQMQVLAAYASDAAWRPEPFARAKSDLANLISQIETRPFGVTSARVPQVLRSGDQRWGLPDRAALAKADLAAARDAIQPALARGLVEINIVGDVTVDEAIAQTAATFGALPNRETKARRAPGGERVSLIPAGPRPVQLTHAGRPDVGLGMIVWQTDDFWDDPRRARVVQVLRAVVELRALEKLREELGTTYSPNVQSETSEAFDEMGLLSVSAEVKPDQIAPLMQVIEEVANEIAAKGLTDDELNRARTPMLAQLEKDRAGNEFWLGRVGGSSWDPRRLESIRQQEALLRSVTLADVKAAAAAYLRPDRARRVVVNPPSNQAGAEGAAVKAASVEMRPDGPGRVVVTPSAPLAGGPN